eukprot:jgi/Undpi1/5935/HiC_scaffold_2.g01209.m1
MFSFGQETPSQENNGQGRRGGLVDRSSSHCGDENGAILPTPGACHAPTAPRRAGRGAAAVSQTVEILELKSRLQELESMVRSAEGENSKLSEENSQLRQQNSLARVDAESARDQAESERARAIVERARAAESRAEADRVLEAARVEAARALDEERAQAAAAAAAAAAEAEATAASAATETAAAIAKATAAAAAATVAAATTAAAEASAAAAVARAEAAELTSIGAAAELARAKDEASRAEAAAEKSVLCSAIADLAAQITAPASQSSEKKRGGTAAARGREEPEGGICTSVAQGRQGGRDEGKRGGGSEAGKLMGFMKGFCDLVLTGTGRDLSADVLYRFLVVTPSGSDRVTDGEQGVAGTPSAGGGVPKAKGVNATHVEVPLSVRVSPPTPAAAVASPATAAAAAIPAVASRRPVTSRREQLNARLAQKEMEKQHIMEKQEKARAERARDAKEKRKKAAARQQQQQQLKADRETKSPRKMQVKAAQIRGGAGGATPPPPLSSAVVPAAPIDAVVNEEYIEDAGVEEVPMPTDDYNSDFFSPGRGSGAAFGRIVACTDGGSDGVFEAGNGMLGGKSAATVAADTAVAAGGATSVAEEEDEARPLTESPSLEPLVGFVIGGEDLTASVTTADVDGGEGEAKDGKKKRRRSIRKKASASPPPPSPPPPLPLPPVPVSSGAATAAAAAGGVAAGRGVVGDAARSERSVGEAGAPKRATIKVETASAISKNAADPAGGVKGATPPVALPRTAASAAAAVAPRGGGSGGVGAHFGEEGPRTSTRRALKSSGPKKVLKRDVGAVDGDAVVSGAERAPVAAATTMVAVAADKAAAAAAAAAVAELSFSVDVTGCVTVDDIEKALRSWFGDVAGGPAGALTAVLATGKALMEKNGGFRCAKSCSSAAVPEITQHLRSMTAAIAAAESCAMKHELKAGGGAGAEAAAAAVAAAAAPDVLAVDMGKKAIVKRPTAVAVGGGMMAVGGGDVNKKKRVRFGAFDLSTIDMPTDAIEDSDVAAKEVAQCLARVVASSKVLQMILPYAVHTIDVGGGDKQGGARDGDGIETWKAFLRGLRSVAAGRPASSCPLVWKVRQACLGLGSEVSAEAVIRAAAFLLDGLEPLEETEVPVRCPLRARLAVILSALIRFNLRVMLNPPPPTYSVPGFCAVQKTGLKQSKVYEVIQLVSGERKPTKKDDYDPTRDGATSAVVTRALRRLYEYSEKGAIQVVSEAEAFVTTIKNESKLSEEDTVQRARQHSLDTVDVVAGVHARNFILELLEFPGVEEAISAARGWGEVERLSSALREVKDSPDADASLTLLADVEGLKGWLRKDSIWGMDDRAKAALTKLDMEARRRMWFPRVMPPTAPTPPAEELGLGLEVSGGERGGAGGESHLAKAYGKC